MLEDLFTDHQRLQREQVANGRDVLLHLVELHRRHGDERIVLPIHHLLLQGGEGLGPCQRRRIDAPSLIGLNHHLVLGHTDHHTAQIVRIRDRLAGIGQHPEARERPADDPHLGIAHGVVHQFAADLALHQRARFIGIAHDVGQRQHAQCGRERRQVVDGQHRHVQRAHGRLVDGVLLAAQLAIGKQGHSMHALRLSFQRLLEERRQLPLGTALGIAHGHLEGGGTGRAGDAQQNGHDQHDVGRFRSHGRSLPRVGALSRASLPGLDSGMCRRCAGTRCVVEGRVTGLRPSGDTSGTAPAGQAAGMAQTIPM